MKNKRIIVSILVALLMVVSPIGSICYASNGDGQDVTEVTSNENVNTEDEINSDDTPSVEQPLEESDAPEDEDVDDLEQSDDVDNVVNDTSGEGGKKLLTKGSPVKSSETFAGGDGSQSNPYQIETVAQLNMIRDNLSAYYIITSDLAFDESDFSEGGQFYNEGKGWIPIGTASDPFNGSLEGNGKTISGIKINADIMYAGLFGYINSASITNLTVQGEIVVTCASSEAYVGSIAGYKDGGSITECVNLTSISSTLLSTTSSSIHYVGGIVGYNKGTIADCLNSQGVSCDNIYSYLGGIAGWSSTVISNSTNNASVEGKEYVGGIVGNGNCANCHNTGNINNSGNPSPKNALSIYTGGVTGNGGCSDCVNDGNVYASATYKPVEAGGISGSGTVSNSVNNGDITGDITGDNNSSVYGDIHVGGIVGSGVGSYCKNYGHIVGAGAGSSAYTYTGGIVGYGYTTAATYSSNSGRVELSTNRSYSYAGGIVGAYGNVEKCYNIGIVNGINAGGISGLGRNIKDCYNAGMVKSNKGCAGGITGKITYKRSMSTCYNIGNVQSAKGAAYAGGLSGANDSGSVTNCFYLDRISVGVAGDQYLGTSASLDEMKAQSLYTGFDFSTIWSINPDADYPLPIIIDVAEVENQENLPMSDSISGMTVVGLESTYQFSGNPIEPSASIEGLIKNTDYKVTYKNNINAGVATITFTGIGNYSGTMTKSFTITPKNLPSIDLSGYEEEYCYTGEPIEPSATLGDLVLGTDYTLSYENNVDGGTATIIATGIGNYTGTVSGSFTIYVPADISGMSFTGLKRTYTYTGDEIIPQISIGNLVKDVDYTLSVENNTSVGTATIKATGKKYYTGELVSAFEIEPADISSFEIDNLKESYVQTGSEIVPNITIDGLVKGEDYTVACSNNVSIGKATITITGIGNYTGGIVKHFSIVDEDISNKKVYISSDTYAYTGEEIKPTVTIVGLVQDEDFTVSYSNNVEVGTADIYVQGTNTFTGERHIPFTITKCSIADLEYKTDKDAYTFTGDSIVPTITVLSAKGNPLVENDDYTVKLYSNTNVGSALFVITGTGNYKGFLVGTFDIVPLSIANGSVSGIANKTYTGKAITQSLTVKVDGKTLKQGSDYTASYKNNTNVGTATLTITGSGNYNGTITKTFKINKAANPLTVKGKTATLKYANVKKKAQTLAVSKVLTVTKNQGKVTYVKASGNSKITINKTTGKVTVKKGLKKGTYSVKVKVTAAGNSNFNSATKTVTFKVIIK